MTDLEERLKRRLEREQRSRLEAETLLEAKASELYELNTHLQEMVLKQEELVKERTKELQEALEAAENANRHKGYFLANMSHEIRTPMNGIIGLSHLLQDTSLEPQQRDYLNKIQASASSLLVIINDILDFSKIESGQLQMDPQEFRLDHVLRDVYDVNHLNAFKKGIELVFDYDFNLPRTMLGDSVRISQVLTNLVNNAIKFTSQGCVFVSVRMIEQMEDKVSFEVQVRDTGIGMSPVVLKSLFQPFTQADASTSRSYGGTGLGLSICKQLVDIMSGSLAVQSEPDVGSVFTLQLTLPIASTVDSKLALDGVSKLSLFAKDASLPNLFYGLRADLVYVASTDTAMVDDQALTDCQLHIVDARGISAAEVDAWLSRLHHASSESGVIIITSQAEKLRLRNKFERELHFLTHLRTPEGLLRSVTNYLSTAEQVVVGGSSQQESKVLFGKKILIAEDNPINMMIATGLIEKMGFEVVSATNGAEALSALAEHDISLVLMDLQMPVMDGFKATHEIRKLPQYKDLPIIALTAHAMVGDSDRSIKAGMNDHLTKPIDPAELKEVLLKWCISSRKTVIGNAAQNSETAVPEMLPGLSLRSALKRIPGGLPQYLDLWGRYKRKYPALVNHIKTLTHEKQLDSLQFVGHDLHGIFSNLGAVNLVAIAKRIEKITDLNDQYLQSVIQDLRNGLEELEQSLSRLRDMQDQKKLEQSFAQDERLIGLLQRVVDLSEGGDADALECCAELARYQLADSYQLQLNLLLQQLEDYDFSEALHSANRLLDDIRAISVK